MARKWQSRRDTIEFIGYIDVSLDQSQKKEYKAWAASVTDLEKLVEEYTENGYKLTLSYDEANECYRCGIMSGDPKNDNAGYIFVGRGSSVFAAMAQAIYKDRYVAQGNWKAFSNQRKPDWD